MSALRILGVKTSVMVAMTVSLLAADAGVGLASGQTNADATAPARGSDCAQTGVLESGTDRATCNPARRRKKKRRAKKKRKTRRGKQEKEKEASSGGKTTRPPERETIEALDLNAAPTEDETKKTSTPALDLSTAGSDSESARQELLRAPGASDGDDQSGAFDFGGGLEFDLGSGGMEFGGEELGDFDLGNLEVESAERERFEDAIELMSDEEYGAASVEFRFFLDTPAFAEFKQESEYQLAKALYKLGFLESALEAFQQILEQGPRHRRYRKSVEWLFFMSRKMADETAVLAELARFRNVSFPKAYRNEYRYLLSKYLFVQANQLEVERIQKEELAKHKSDKAAGIDFSSIADALETGGSDALDFSSLGDGFFGGFDVGGDGSGRRKGKGKGKRRGSGGSMDFGAGGADSGGSMDFGAGGADSGGAMDFGAGGAGSGGAMDFGASPPPTPTDPAGEVPVRDQAPTTATEAIRQGLDLVAEVDTESRYYAQAKYLQGLLHYLGAADQKAVEAFQEVVRVLNPREGIRLDPQLREMSFLSLARIHYGHKQFNRSAYYYDLIDRDSENWLTALFEASWAYYQRGDFEKALGNLLTLHSPFFQREYFPESQIVKAIIYFEACRYPETRRIVDDFLKRFTRVMREIQQVAESKEPAERLYERINQMQAMADGDDGDDATARVMSLTLGDSEIATARNVVRQVEEQLALLQEMPHEFQESTLGKHLSQRLRATLRERMKAAGDTARQKFEQELYELKSLLAQALRIKIEVARAEREILQSKMRGEAAGDELVPALQRSVVDDEHLYWPYEGEYWRDELGTYELDFSMCRPLSGEGQ